MEKLQVCCQGGRVWLYPSLEVKFILKINRFLTRVAGTVKHSLPNQIGNTLSKFVHSFFNYEQALKGGRTWWKYYSKDVNSYSYLDSDSPIYLFLSSLGIRKLFRDMKAFCVKRGVFAIIQELEGIAELYRVSDGYLSGYMKKRIQIKPDGHCLPRAVFNGLKRKGSLPDHHNYKE